MTMPPARNDDAIRRADCGSGSGQKASDEFDCPAFPCPAQDGFDLRGSSKHSQKVAASNAAHSLE